MSTETLEALRAQPDVAVARALAYLRRKHPKAVILPFGSAAWGETTQVGGRSWVSDIEIGIVGGIWMRMRARRASRFLSIVLDRDVDVFWIRPARLRRGSRRNFGPAFPNLHAFNLSRSQILGRLPRRARPVRRWRAAELPASEGLILILNRIGELLAGPADPSYARGKVAMSCGDAILIARGLYRPTYAERRESLARLLAEEPALLGDGDAARTILDAYGFKVPAFAPGVVPGDQELAAAVVSALVAIVGPGDGTIEDLARRVRAQLTASWIGHRASPMRSTIRGAYSVFRGRGHIAARHGWRLLGREPLEVPVYTALLVGYLGGRDDALGRIVPRLTRATAAGDTSTTDTVVRLWRAYCY